MSDFRGQLGITVKNAEQSNFSPAACDHRRHSQTPLSPGTHAGGMLQLVLRERQGAESHTVCPVWAGTVSNITRSDFFRSKSNRAWASEHGLLPKNTVTERLNNIRNSLSNWSRIHMWTNPRVFTVGGES